jgi:transposase
MYQHYLGVDLHRKRTYVVLMDSQGNISDQQRMTNDAMTDYVAQLPPNTFAVLEATGNWSYMYDVLAAKLDKVVLAHPKRVQAIAAARIKTDRIDATILAHLARTNLLPTAYAPPVEVRELREVVRHRAKLVRERTRHKNRIHRVLAQYNIHAPCSDLFGKQGRLFLVEVRDRLSSTSQLLLEDYLHLIETLNERITALNQLIHAWAKSDPRAALLMSMPGVGEYSAAVILAEIGDVHRFPGSKQLCSFAGLIPSTRSSDMRVRHGRITKEGSPWLRWIMINAAQRAPCASPRLGQFFARLARKQGRKNARVALARKMLSIVYCMLRDNEPYREEHRPS